MMTVESLKCHKQVHLAHVTDLILSVNSLDTSTANVDSSYFTIHAGAEIIAENESIVDHGDGTKIILSAKDEVNHNIAKDAA